MLSASIAVVVLDYAAGEAHALAPAPAPRIHARAALGAPIAVVPLDPATEVAASGRRTEIAATGTGSLFGEPPAPGAPPPEVPLFEEVIQPFFREPTQEPPPRPRPLEEVVLEKPALLAATELPKEPRKEPALVRETLEPSARFLGSGVPEVTPEALQTYYGEETLTRLSDTGFWSKISVGFRVRFGLIFDDNVFLSDRNKESDLLLTVTPSIDMRLGSDDSALLITANYSASGVISLGGSSEDYFDHWASINARYRFTRLTLGLQISPRSLTGASRDAGDRVGRDLLYVGLTSNYMISEKASVDLNADFSIADYDGLLGSREERIQGFFNYHVRPKLQLGIGAGFGTLNADGGSTQTYWQALVRAVYTATEKLSINAFAGLEFRQFDSGIGNETTPVFSIGASYTPREGTLITLDARRRTYASAALAGQNYQVTGFVLTVNQQLTARLSASLAGGYEHTNYESAETGVVATRRDDYYFVRLGVDWSFSSALTAGIFYEFSLNDSSGSGARSFERNRFGLMASFAF